MFKMQRPLFWHQGLFLQPQHFQLQDQALQSRMIPWLKYQAPFFWGVAAMEIDLGALGTQCFKLLSGSFLFQDGTYLEFPGNAWLEPRSLRGALTEGKSLRVYLGLKRWNPAAENVTVIDSPTDAATVTTRFLTFPEPEEVKDLHGKGPDGQVRQLSYRLKLLWESELEESADFLAIPLARLESFSTPVLSKSFIPPSLTLTSVEPLTRLVGEIRDLLIARSRNLEQYKQQRGVHNAEFGSRDMVYLLALMTLNRHLPKLCHLTDASPVHPWLAYGALRQLIGELSSFSLRIDALGSGSETQLPAYDHTRIGECFTEARNLVVQLLDEITAGPDYVLRLVHDGTFFSADLRPAQLDAGNRYFLALRTGQDPQAVAHSLESVAKLSSREHLPVLDAHALPGLRLQHLQAPPQELPRRSQTLYLSIDHYNEQWETVVTGHNLALHWDDAPADLEVELMILEPGKPV
ncbi:MAG TPA: type VI secretion system baseplate subunit TssK [Geomonas sp.]|nr:type VI secretion system baseplate subunit TssK [Geomonas sp.]